MPWSGASSRRSVVPYREWRTMPRCRDLQKRHSRGYNGTATFPAQYSVHTVPLLASISTSTNPCSRSAKYVTWKWSIFLLFQLSPTFQHIIGISVLNVLLCLFILYLYTVLWLVMDSSVRKWLIDWLIDWLILTLFMDRVKEIGCWIWNLSYCNAYLILNAPRYYKWVSDDRVTVV